MKKTLKSLRKKAWTIFSRWVRTKEKGVCFTCGKRFEISETDAGHFVHRDCLDFDERNIHCQCSRCNRYLHGNLTKYAEHLIKKYGPDIIKELNHLGSKVKKFSRKELEDIINKYK